MPVPSPEIEAVARRVLKAWQARDGETIANMFSNDPSLRVLGFAEEEQWCGPEQFLGIFEAQAREMPDWRIDIEHAEAFESGEFGWVTLITRLTTPEIVTPMRQMALLRLESGAWKVMLWQNSIPVPNQQVFGVSLTTSLGELVNSILEDDSPLASVAGSEGTWTLVFTDIVDSSVLAEAKGDVAWAAVVAAHEGTIRRITESEGGTVVKMLGDGSMLAFESARAAMRAALRIHHTTADSALEIRIGIHTGEVIRTGDDLLGTTVNKAARIAASANPGEVLASSTTWDLIGAMDGVDVGETRILALKGLGGSHPVVVLLPRSNTSA